MSDSEETLTKWRASGSLQFLAHELNVTTKQVTRWWDLIGIPGSHRTPKGQRRIRYDEQTIKTVCERVDASKTTNIEIRYRLPSINYKGKVIRTEDCRTMQDLYRCALKSGLSIQAAKNLAFRPRLPKPPLAGVDLWFDLHQTITRTLVEDVLSQELPLSIDTWRELKATSDDASFRSAAKQAWMQFLRNNSQTDDSFDEFASRSPRRFRLKEYKELMHSPTRASFFTKLDALQEVESRVLKLPAKTSGKFRRLVATKPKKAVIMNAALKLELQEKPITRGNLADLLEISRPALYRIYGAQLIKDSLTKARKESLSITVTRPHGASSWFHLDSKGKPRCPSVVPTDYSDAQPRGKRIRYDNRRESIEKNTSDEAVSQWIKGLSQNDIDSGLKVGWLKRDETGTLCYTASHYPLSVQPS
jgi:hypothetical protein